MQQPAAQDLLQSKIPARLASNRSTELSPNYAAAAERYFGPDQGQGWVNHLRTLISSMVRIPITPEWVGRLDFQTRFPSALAG
jgi:hypothetical protein